MSRSPYKDRIYAAEKAYDEDLEGDSEINWELECASADFQHDLANEYLKMLKNEYEYFTGREAIIESVVANELEFKENGKRFF